MINNIMDFKPGAILLIWSITISCPFVGRNFLHVHVPPLNLTTINLEVMTYM